jgi:hypothetical protein
MNHARSRAVDRHTHAGLEELFLFDGELWIDVVFPGIRGPRVRVVGSHLPDCVCDDTQSDNPALFNTSLIASSSAWI